MFSILNNPIFQTPDVLHTKSEEFQPLGVCVPKIYILTLFSVKAKVLN